MVGVTSSIGLTGVGKVIDGVLAGFIAWLVCVGKLPSWMAVTSGFVNLFDPLDHSTGEIPASNIDGLLEHAPLAPTSADAPVTAPKEGITPFEPADFQETRPSTEKSSLAVVHDVELNLSIELGRTNMFLEDVLKLQRGAVIPLDKLAGDPVDIFVNGRLVARGEVLVLNENFCVRVAELISGD